MKASLRWIAKLCSSDHGNSEIIARKGFQSYNSHNNPLDTGRKLNVPKTFRRRGSLLNVLCTFNLRPVSRGEKNCLKLILVENRTVMYWCLISVHGCPGAIHWCLVTVHWSLSRSIHWSMPINCNTATFVLSSK